MSDKALRKEIRVKELQLNIKSMETSVERFELELLKSKLEETRLIEEIKKSNEAIEAKRLELAAIIKETN